MELKNNFIHHVYFWLKNHIWRICYWILLVTAFISAYKGDDVAYRIGHAVLNTFGVWGMLNIGMLSFCEKVAEVDKVIAAKEKESGITIHWVNENYDEGAIIFQAKCFVDASDTSATLANKIHSLEHEHFAPTIEATIEKEL